ncbi:MAG: hypothetical protein FWD58_02335 [Firmicutes bacterium]|nr:hypothetical protein [Bacillota bacterium]
MNKPSDRPEMSGENEILEKVLSELAELKRCLVPSPTGEAALHSEVLRLRDDLNKAQSFQDLRSELNRLKEQVERIMLPARTDHRRETPELLAGLTQKLDAALYGTGAGEEISNLEILVADVGELKERLARSDEKIAESFAKLSEEFAERCAVIATAGTEGDEDVALLLEDLAVVHERINAIGGETGEAPAGMLGALMAEVRACRDELAEIKSELAGLKKRPKADEPPSLDILAEIRLLGDKLSGIADGKGTQPQSADLLTEVRLLSDRLFAVSMANVADADGKTGYESYNNLILDELGSLREEIARLGLGVRDQGAGIGVQGSWIGDQGSGVRGQGSDNNSSDTPHSSLLTSNSSAAKQPATRRKPTAPITVRAKKHAQPDIESILENAQSDILTDEPFLTTEAKNDRLAANPTKSGANDSGAKKMANKLIFEELVRGLGDRSEAEEIVQEIQPKEEG